MVDLYVYCAYKVTPVLRKLLEYSKNISCLTDLGSQELGTYKFGEVLHV